MPILFLVTLSLNFNKFLFLVTDWSAAIKDRPTPPRVPVKTNKMSRGPSFKPGDRVVFRSNPLNREAVARGQVKRIVVEDNLTSSGASTTNPAITATNTKYVVKNIATGKESVLTAAEIVSRQ